ncbi:hypothetical protein CFC21_080623 [Triticum aestivum]|uniref:Uncharacterized protein n=2 Tax=Triticum aestivum TaxID=4565 RepID=A0A9R1I2I1_WHEAT|nr:hypothetical protein CFC21_080622 [Triticum aestivum]KAF7075889.1 hypothetical protein CFC21_080623 [Triticum aestivum]
MTAASDKRRKDVAELEHGLEHNGDIRLLPTSTARSFACLRSRHARCVQCAPITRTGRAGLAATAYCPAPLRPQPQRSTSVPPCCCVSLKPPPRRSSAASSPCRRNHRGLLAAPHTSIDRHTARSIAQPPANSATAGTPPARRTTPKMNQLMIPMVHTLW